MPKRLLISSTLVLLYSLAPFPVTAAENPIEFPTASQFTGKLDKITYIGTFSIIEQSMPCR